MIEFDIAWPTVIGLLVSVILPLLVGLVTKRMTDSGVKAGLLALLAALTGVLTEFGNALIQGQPFNIAMAIVMVIVAFITGVGMHFGLFKPIGASAAVQAVGDHSAH
jgi:hypothetical protein